MADSSLGLASGCKAQGNILSSRGPKKWGFWFPFNLSPPKRTPPKSSLLGVGKKEPLGLAMWWNPRDIFDTSLTVGFSGNQYATHKVLDL